MEQASAKEGNGMKEETNAVELSERIDFVDYHYPSDTDGVVYSKVSIDEARETMRKICGKG